MANLETCPNCGASIKDGFNPGSVDRTAYSYAERTDLGIMFMVMQDFGCTGCDTKLDSVRIDDPTQPEGFSAN